MHDRAPLTIALVAALLSMLPIPGTTIAGAEGTFDGAQTLFYSAQYEAAAQAALALQPASGTDLRAAELHSTAVLFQLRRAIGDATDKEKAFKQCAHCPALVEVFRQHTVVGLTDARARLKRDPADDEALYFLGKLDLNHVWLYLGTLGRKTGWNEYWEARRSLDQLLARNPGHVRARVARAWIDYIVDTQVGWGRKWILGGGNRARALSVVREAAAMTPTDVFIAAEARFALWDMEVREKNVPAALAAARSLQTDFPDNHELRKYIADHSK